MPDRIASWIRARGGLTGKANDGFHIRKEFLKSFGPTYSDEQRETLQKEVLEELLQNWKSVTPVDISTVSAVEVMKIIGRLKESNLSLVHNNSLNKGSSQLETTQLVMARNQMDEELAAWDEKIVDAENELEEIREVHEKLKNQIRNLEQEGIERHKEFRELELKKLTEIYKLCTGSDVQVDDPLLMKVAIDHTVQGILIEMNTFPRKKIKELLKAGRRAVLLARWIIWSVPLEIVGSSDHKKVLTCGKLDLERPGRPRRERIVWQALVDPTVTRSTIRADVGIAIVPQTISRHLAEANLKSKRPFRALGTCVYGGAKPDQCGMSQIGKRLCLVMNPGLFWGQMITVYGCGGALVSGTIPSTLFYGTLPAQLV
ncbi:uncharacterized protein TNCV_5043851 [Trichonephila clavipes]|uniref:Uncharacterized protein n=1 Tax=Trichonephila clavipes TaxID=2585209 RepID=A0A8X6WIN0_TRICX|nr:uncharacterized protein TNCV_5043851 [Trichonephila clavipes]